MTVAAPKPSLPPLDRPVTSLWGVGPERAEQLARLEIRTVGDLLLHAPRRHENRREFRPIAELRAGDAAITRGKVVAMGVKWYKMRTRSIFELVLDDGSARLHCRWWNLPFMERYFKVGDELVVFGKLVGAKPRTVDHPETETLDRAEETLIHLNRITPVYPLTEGLPQRWLRSLIWRTLEREAVNIVEPWPDLRLADRGCPTRADAVRMLHFPDEPAEAERGRRRLALDEFLDLQRQIHSRRRNFQTKAQAWPCAGNNLLVKPFLGRLGFKLTQGQTQVLKQVRRDLGGEHPMRRLLQGDVGSGKTVVAACAGLMTLESGYSVALMAPTEILANQHFRTFRDWFAPLNVPVALLTGSQKIGAPPGPSPGQDSLRPSLCPEPSTSERSDGQSGRQSDGTPTLYIGTHALLEAAFVPDNLGLVVIDEQHRFGVTQREQLVRKGRYPHLLVMTATPIPRTLGLTLYGDLEISTLTEMPPGRGRIRTYVRTTDKLAKVWGFVRTQLQAGRQAYVVYPRVEETGQGVKAVTKEFEALQKALSPFRVAMLHGRLKAAEKEAAMAAFRANTAQVLLATSLIEVGVDVPNATMLVIENAEQFGLAQLHQLRGRIGRSRHDAHCILVADDQNPDARRRLAVLEQTTDGFKIAEADLELRGPGELLGQQQSGLPKLRFGNLVADADLVREARELVMGDG
jgi:ATP-dependent DNA helicase RecG